MYYLHYSCGEPDHQRPMNRIAIARNLMVTLMAFGFVLQSLDAHAQEALRPLPPVLSAISDEVGALSESEGEALAEIVADARRASGVRIIIVIVETTVPENIESYTHRLRAQWQARRPPSPGRRTYSLSSQPQTVPCASPPD